MNDKFGVLNKVLLSIVLLLSIILITIVILNLPKVIDSTIKLNNAKCLESYNSQGQPPMGACGYDF